MRNRALLLASVVAAAAFGVATPAHADFPPYMPDAVAADAPTFAAEAGEDVLGEIAVDVKDDLSEEAIAQLGRDYGITLEDNSPDIKDDGKVELAHVAPGMVASLVARLSADPRVEAAEPMHIVRASFMPNDPKFKEQWHMSRVNATRAWDYACGKGVTVAVIDTGVACYDGNGFMKGSDLRGTSCVPGYNFVGKNAFAADDQGHGTHVAGTIAQTTNNGVGVAGLAHCANLMPVKVLSARGWGTSADVAEGIRWAADHGAHVINMSLGSPQRSGVIENAVKHAVKKGVIIVAAAGNNGRAVGFPAAYDGVIAVSATDRNDAIAWFSSRGPQIAIGAPGVAVTQQTICESGKNKCEQWGVFNGTSMASPHVAGAAALLVGQGITDADAVKSVLQATAKPKTEKNLFGAGILDAGNAVARTHWSHIGLRLSALATLAFVVFRRIKKRGGKLAPGAGKVLGALFGAVGLLPFLPLLGIAGPSGPLGAASELLMRPLGEWDLVLGVDLHKWLLLASALPAFAGTAVFFGAKRLRPMVGGFALGTAALLTQIAASGEVAYIGGPVLLRVWAAANIAVCLFLARMSLDTKG